MERSDAVVVGAGHNGLAAGVVLASAGWSVTVLERSDEPGGAVRTAEVTLPGFRHDLYATNLNQFAGSQFVAEFGDDLAACGLEFAGTHHPFASAFPDGGLVGVTTDSEAMLAGIRAFSERDAENWAALTEWFGRISPHLFPVLGVPLPSAAAARTLWAGTRALGRGWPFELGRLAVQSARELVEEHFETREVQALCASWGMHLDFPPDHPGGALFALVETFASAANGMALGKGGARTMIDAMTELLVRRGGRIVTGADVERIEIRAGRATAAVLRGGERYEAERAVVANLTPRALFGTLVPAEALPEAFYRRISRYRYAPGTLMVHLALERLPDWTAGEAARSYAYVHLGPYLDDMSLAYVRAVAGLLPERPTLVVGQPTAVDPTRAPNGKHVLWVQARHMPATIRGDAAGEISATDWDGAKEPYADRIVAILAGYAPGIADLVLGRHVLSPLDIERANPNLVGGDQVGGSHHPAQNFFLRPIPGWSRYRTPIDGLYMCGAATWPGAGVGAGSGYILGKLLTKPRRFARRRR
jgi:phytoene dehydrogenase-like protein